MPPRSHQARHLASLALLVAAGIAIAGPTSAENENLCTEFPGAAGDACQEALDLLMREPPDLPQYDLTVLVTGTGQTWRHEYRLADGWDASLGEITCVPEGALTLPRGKTVRLLFTADDDIYEWDLPALGIKATAIPGRIEEVYLEASATGTFTGLPTNGIEDLAPLVEVLDGGSFGAWREGTLLKSCEDT